MSKVTEIKKLVRGLTYISETDAPFKVKEITNMSFVDPISFFERLTKKESWHSPAETKSAERFAQLYDYLQKNFDSLQIGKSGEVNCEIVIICRNIDENNCITISTKSVET